LSAQKDIALQAVAKVLGEEDVPSLIRQIMWDMAETLLKDAGATSGDSGPTVYDKVFRLATSKEMERGC